MGTNKYEKVSAVFKASWRLMTVAERRRSVILAAFQVAVRVIDFVAIASIVPLVMMTLDPAKAARNGLFVAASQALRIDSPERLTGLFGIAALVLLVLSSTGSVLAQSLVSRHGNACHKRLSHQLLEKVMDAPIVWLHRQNISVLVRLLSTDVPFWSRDFIERSIVAAGYLSTVCISITAIVVVTPLQGLIAVMAFGGLALLVFYRLRPNIARYAREHRVTADEFAKVLGQLLGGAKDIKVSKTANFFIRHADEIVGRSAEAKRMLTVLHMISPTFLMFAGQSVLLIAALFLWYSGMNVAEAGGQLVLLLLVTSRVVPSLVRMNSSGSRFVDVAPYVLGLVNLIEELDRQEKPGTGSGPVPTAWAGIRVDGVDFRYPEAAVNALEGITLDLPRRGHYGIVGHSGSGKSTLIDIVLGLLKPDCGAVHVGGVDLSSLSLADWHGKIGMVPQSPFIADMSLRENVAFGVACDRIDDARVNECLRMAHLGDLVPELPSGLETRMGDRGVLLSGGQRQRVAIARALYREPSILILDEATSALDNVSEKEVQKAISELSSKMTILTIAHRFSTIRDADKIFVMENGRIVGEGSYDNLMSSCAIFRHLALAQATE